jgi:hypothetical protein
MNENLYVILPYYNYFHNKYRVSNILKFIETYKNIDKCKIVVVEGLIAESEPLEDLSDKIFKHIKYDLPQKIWVKENLINLVLQNHLPQDYNFFCWLDSDIFFENKDWVDNSINLLKENDAIQMFNFGINQRSRIEYDEIPFSTFPTNSKLKGHNTSISSIAYLSGQYDISNFNPHTGFGWGMTRNFYNKIGKLWDYNIIGSADSVIGRSIVQNLSEEQILNRSSLNIIYSEDYGKQIIEYYKRFKDCKYSFLPSRIYHFFHGDMKDKSYVERHFFLKKFNYDISMVNYNDDGIIYTNKREIASAISYYMISREIKYSSYIKSFIKK